jgi:protein-disulfide isomerase-like protein with CxxC motif
MRTCRFCRSHDDDLYQLIHYSVRHYAHPDCLLKAKGAAAFDLLHDWQIRSFPALAASRAGLLDELIRRCAEAKS